MSHMEHTREQFSIEFYQLWCVGRIPIQDEQKPSSWNEVMVVVI